jgi:hypothetical protein
MPFPHKHEQPACRCHKWSRVVVVVATTTTTRTRRRVLPILYDSRTASCPNPLHMPIAKFHKLFTSLGRRDACHQHFTKTWKSGSSLTIIPYTFMTMMPWIDSCTTIQIGWPFFRICPWSDVASIPVPDWPICGAIWCYGNMVAFIPTWTVLRVHICKMAQPLPPTTMPLYFVERGRFLAQYWIATSPRHPLMFHAAFKALQNLMQLPDIGQQYVPTVTGPRKLVDGWEAFLGRRGRYARYPRPGLYVGRSSSDAGTGSSGSGNNRNRTATVKGPAKEANRWVQRLAVTSAVKHKGYESMGIVNYRNAHKVPSNNVSCYARMLQTAQNKNKTK